MTIDFGQSLLLLGASSADLAKAIKGGENRSSLRLGHSCLFGFSGLSGSMNEISKIDQLPVARFPPVALVSVSATQKFTIHY